MKKLGITLLLLISTSVLAFGGGGGSGSGRISRAYNKGLNALGIHVGGNDQADVEFTCGSNAHPDEQGVCVCDDGYVEDSEGACVINQCSDFTPTDCITACDPVTGDKTYADLCHNNEYYCNNNHECINPCDEGHPEGDCIQSYHAESGTCVPDYAETGATCGTNKTCKANHQCTCADGYEDVDGTCMKECPTGQVRNDRGFCTIDCGTFRCFIAQIQGDYYDDILNACGGIDYVATVEDLQCNLSNGICSNLSTDLLNSGFLGLILNSNDLNQMFVLDFRNCQQACNYINYDMQRPWFGPSYQECCAEWGCNRCSSASQFKVLCK